MSFFISLLYALVIICSLFLICLVLIQRGRGGGLAGAFGGAGGSSAFGTKAGDVFTRITIVTATIWIGLNMLLVLLSNWSRAERSAFAPDQPAAAVEGTIEPGRPGLAPAAEDQREVPRDPIIPPAAKQRPVGIEPTPPGPAPKRD